MNTLLRTILAAVIGAAICIMSLPLTAMADETQEVAELYEVARQYMEREDGADYDSWQATVIAPDAGVYLTPEDVTPYDTAKEGGTVEVIAETGGWSLITTDDSVAFMQSATLSKPYSEEDLDVLAHVICGEAQCYDDTEQLYVGSVVLNRVASSRYPDTIRGVVFQRGQYACTWDGNYYRTPAGRNWANAKYLLEHGPILPPEVVYQSGGRQGKGVYVKTKRHYYCY